MATLQTMDIDHPASRQMSYDEKWELHKPLLARLYLDEKLKLPKIRAVMLIEHDFRAETHQYKYRFGKWGWTKILTSIKKDKIIEIGQRRATQGRSTAIKQQNRKIESKQLLRHIRERNTDMKLFSRESTVELPSFMSASLLGLQTGFMVWNLPQQYILQHVAQTHDHLSPFDVSNTPPSDISVQTPPDPEGMSPGLVRAFSSEVTELHAERLLAGDYGALLRSLDNNGKRVLADWMNQFWYFCFLTAKHWGRQSNIWTADDLRPFTQAIESAAPSPQYIGLEDSTPIASSSFPSPNLTRRPYPAAPAKLCNWTIHVNSEQWEYIVEDSDEYVGPEPIRPSFESRMLEALQTNSFSTVPTSELPISLERISDIVSSSPAESFSEGLKFAIMSCNIELLTELLEDAGKHKESIQAIKPLHLALTYIDGSRSCCHIFRMILGSSEYLRLRLDELGPSGFALFDTLMVHILRNHTGVSPRDMHGDMVDARIFGGEDVDSCGRWDAENRDYRRLKQTGSDVPLEWKHKFCNTSIQAVCHCMVYLIPKSPKISSGALFLRRCFTCGLKMTYPSVHLVVLTAWHLACFGDKAEELFGMVCVILCMACSAAPDRGFSEGVLFKAVYVDVTMFGIEQVSLTSKCAHEKLRPSELAEKLSTSNRTPIPATTEKGWSVFCRVLEHIEAQYRWAQSGVAPSGYTADDDELDSCDDDSESNAPFIFIGMDDIFHTELKSEEAWEYQGCDHGSFGRAFGRNRVLGHLWAVCQVELLTYRRRQEGASWMSDYLTIDIIERYLDTEDPEVLPMIKQGKLKGYCVCGLFGGQYPSTAPTQESACDGQYGNLNDSQRAAYLDDCDFVDDW